MREEALSRSGGLPVHGVANNTIGSGRDQPVPAQYAVSSEDRRPREERPDDEDLAEENEPSSQDSSTHSADRWRIRSANAFKEPPAIASSSSGSTLTRHSIQPNRKLTNCLRLRKVRTNARMTTRPRAAAPMAASVRAEL